MGHIYCLACQDLPGSARSPEIWNGTATWEQVSSLREVVGKLAEALQFVIDEHRISNRELERMGGSQNKPAMRVIKATEALSLAQKVLDEPRKEEKK